MESVLNAVTRPVILFAWLFVLFVIEIRIPLTVSNRRIILPNILFTFLSIIIYSLFGLLIILVGTWTSANHFGVFNWADTNIWITLILSVMLLDFWAAYVSHILMHKIGWLWKAHSVHHSDTMVDVTTALRHHPVESVVRSVFLLSGMFMLGSAAWVVVVYQTLSTFIAQIEHSNISINPRVDKLLQLAFSTPNYHKIHHSKFQPETDSNYGNIFSLWDRIFSTMKKRNSYNNIEYGLNNLEGAKNFTFADLLKLPYRKPVKRDDISKNQTD